MRFLLTISSVLFFCFSSSLSADDKTSLAKHLNGVFGLDILAPLPKPAVDNSDSSKKLLILGPGSIIGVDQVQETDGFDIIFWKDHSQKCTPNIGESAKKAFSVLGTGSNGPTVSNKNFTADIYIGGKVKFGSDAKNFFSLEGELINLLDEVILDIESSEIFAARDVLELKQRVDSIASACKGLINGDVFPVNSFVVANGAFKIFFRIGTNFGIVAKAADQLDVDLKLRAKAVVGKEEGDKRHHIIYPLDNAFVGMSLGKKIE